jgi:hypothetical protein
MNAPLPARKRGRPPGTTRPSKPDKKVKTGISMKPAEWMALDSIAQKKNLSRGELIASLIREETARR